MPPPATIRLCRDDERVAIVSIVNRAAEAYRGVIPADRWHEPYMSAAELDREIAAGISFWGWEADGELVGIMGIQPLRDVTLIRHAYVLPGSQGHGVGGKLLEHLQRLSAQRTLVGTWAAADWAIRFYRRHGFELVSPQLTRVLLEKYWTIPDRQVESSVVLARPPLERPGPDPGTAVTAEGATSSREVQQTKGAEHEDLRRRRHRSDAPRRCWPTRSIAIRSPAPWPARIRT